MTGLRVKDAGLLVRVNGDEVPYFDITTSKIGNMPASSAANAQLKSRMLATDVITETLMNLWCDTWDESLEDEAYVFPKFDADGIPDFTQSMTNDQHNAVCREVMLRFLAARPKISARAFGTIQHSLCISLCAFSIA